MPTYPYACTACDHRFEQVQAFSDPSLTECPECGGRLRKVFSSVGIVFKGSGWYRNDSRSGSSSSSGSSSEKSDSSNSGSPGSSGASEKADKPAATKNESTSEKPAAAKEKSGAASGSSSSSTGSTAASST